MIARDDVWLLWEWSEDSYLAEDFLWRAAARNLRVRAITPSEFDSIAVNCPDVVFPGIIWDRASDVYPQARCISDWAEASNSRIINPVRGLMLARDKAHLHRLLLQQRLPVPETTILQSASNPADMACQVEKYQVLKPATSGGGEGVRMAEWDENSLMSEMQTRPEETWLLQEYIQPAEMAGRRAWFRVFYLLGDVRVCWWDDQTHIYELIPCEEVTTLGFSELKQLIRRIAFAFPFQFFSAEIAFRYDGQPVIVDYINDLCDLRSRSRIYNGVPPELLDWVFQKIFEASLSPLN